MIVLLPKKKIDRILRLTVRTSMFAFCLGTQPIHDSLGADKPKPSSILPPGGSSGTTVEVTASGKFPVWPLEVWSDSPAIQWSAKSESGKLQARIGTDATVGLHWMRMYHVNGATTAFPFLVSSFQERLEKEPNDQTSECQELPNEPQIVQGILNKRGDVDLYSVDLKANELLVATIDSGKWLSSPADTNLQITDAKGFVLAENLDHVGLDPYLEHRAAYDGRYFVKVFGFPATPNSTIGFGGGSDWVYRLQLTSISSPFGKALDFDNQSLIEKDLIELESGQYLKRDQPFELMLPGSVRGTLQNPDEKHFFRFAAKAQTNYRIRLLAREFGSSLDGSLAILDAQGTQLASQDDVGNNRDPVLQWKASVDGQFTVSISDFHRNGGPDYPYCLFLDEWPASYTASTTSDLISSTIGKESEIAVAVERDKDFKETITFRIEGLPSHVQCASVESKHGSDSAKKVTLKLIGREAFQGPVQIVSRVVSSPEQGSKPIEHFAKAPDHKPLWLSVAAE